MAGAELPCSGPSQKGSNRTRASRQESRRILYHPVAVTSKLLEVEPVGRERSLERPGRITGCQRMHGTVGKTELHDVARMSAAVLEPIRLVGWKPADRRKSTKSHPSSTI